jgi:hypothetical protein
MKKLRVILNLSRIHARAQMIDPGSVRFHDSTGPPRKAVFFMLFAEGINPGGLKSAEWTEKCFTPTVR